VAILEEVVVRFRACAGFMLLVGALLPAFAAAPASAAPPSPAWSHTFGGWNRSSSPTIADVDGDGRNDIVHGHQDGWLRVLDAATGTNLPGWPQPNQVWANVATAIDGSPAVADLDRDGANEIVVPGGSTWKANQPGGVVVFRRDGSIKCRFQTGDEGNVWANTPGPDGYPDGVYSSPAIGDIDGDNFPDIVFGAWDLRVHAIDRNCNRISGFPYNVEDSTWGSPALYDSDDDGRLEIFIGSDQFAGGFIDWSGGEMRALDWANGSVRELWKRRVDDVIHSSAAIGDINGDGRVEAVVGGGNFYNRGDGRRVFAWHVDDGSTVPGWPQSTGGATNSSPALGDVTGDGVPEVAIGSGDGILRVFHGNGQLYWQRQLRFINGPGHAIFAHPIIADMNGDGRNDVAVGNDWGFFVMDGFTSNELYSVNEFYSFEAAGAVGDFGSLGWRLIVSGFDTPNQTTRIQAFPIPRPGVTPPWPMFRRTATHIAAPPSGGNPIPPGFCRRSSNPFSVPAGAAAPRGYWVLGYDGGLFAFGGAPFFGSIAGRLNGAAAVGMQASPSGNGYYILTNRGEIHPFGDARSHGSMAGIPLNAPIIALAPTPSGNGYWLLGRDGGVFSFGDARFFGSTGGMSLNAPVISMAPTPTGNGYWLLAGDGGVFSFGDARFFGSTGGMRLAAPVISMATTKTAGYWLVAGDGGVFSFGVPYHGSLPGTGLCNLPLSMQMRATLTGNGYYVLAADGGIYAFGDAPFHGSFPGLSIGRHAVDLVVRP
jgi:FG-GAP-like repeat